MLLYGFGYEYGRLVLGGILLNGMAENSVFHPKRGRGEK